MALLALLNGFCEWEFNSTAISYGDSNFALICVVICGHFNRNYTITYHLLLYAAFINLLYK